MQIYIFSNIITRNPFFFSKKYKTLIFNILQAKYFLETNTYISTKKRLLEKLSGFDKEILDICINKSNIKNMNLPELERLYEILIKWTSANI